MSTLSIKVPAVGGKTLDVRGDQVGRFLVHKDIEPRLASDGEWIDGFSVTLISNGCRFPWAFESKTNATRFAVGVERLVKWNEVECELSENVVHLQPKVRWRVGPNQDEREAVFAFASECGGFKT